MRDDPVRAPAVFFFRRQWLHAIALTALLVIALRAGGSELRGGEWLGLDSVVWFRAGLAVAVVHQLFVWLAWRAELCWQSVTRSAGFTVYRAVFLSLLLLRPVTAVGVAVADAGSCHAQSPVSWTIASTLLLPAAWGGWSVMRYFGVTRATGADHFDPAYRSLPFVRRGAFKHVPNAMYVLVFLVFWAVAVASGSRNAYVLAFFSHAYIWVHYWCTERPDMDVIYGPRLAELRAATVTR